MGTGGLGQEEVGATVDRWTEVTTARSDLTRSIGRWGLRRSIIWGARGRDSRSTEPFSLCCERMRVFHGAGLDANDATGHVGAAAPSTPDSWPPNAKTE